MLLDFEPHWRLREYVGELNRLYQAEPALYEDDFSWSGFDWIDFRDVDHSIVSFVRHGRQPGDDLVVVANFTPVVREGYRLGVPAAGFYRELLNSDSAHYWGSNVGNAGGTPSDDLPWQGQPHSLLLTLPPLGIIFMKRVSAGAEPGPE
jgi:1,4-alpha-glucan branching enzyme